MKKVAILGQPNVGKSSLFNRLLKQKKAITSDLSGTTRDVNSSCADLDGMPIEIFDTGGIDDSSPLFRQVQSFTFDLTSKVDLILYVVDGKSPPQDQDRKLFFTLQKQSKLCILVINKIDNDKDKQNAWEFANFGAKHSFMISASHNRGIQALKNSITTLLPPTPSPQPIQASLETSPIIRVGIIGRVNVGKSSLLNALLGKDRSVVSEVAGTTIDPVDEEIEFSHHRITFIDTAGIRRRSKIEGIEKYALDRTRQILQRSDIALLVLDVSEGFVELDERISSLIQEFSLASIVLLNKWDIKKGDFQEIKAEYRRKFRFLEYAPFITTSATSKRHIQEIKSKIIEIYANYTKRIPTSKLNEAIEEATQRHPIPSDHGKLIRIYYATQYDISPPRIAIVMNRPKALHFSYQRYLVNFLRDRFGFEGTPILISAKDKSKSIES